MAQLDKKRRGELLRGVFDVLADHPDGIQAKDALKALENRIELTEYEAANYPGSDTRRFENTVRFQTITAVKAGWMVKEAGIWSPTEEGLAAYKTFSGPEDFLENARKLYKVWEEAQPPKEHRLMPSLYDADGEVVLDEDGNPMHLHPDQGANVRLRELAFHDRRPSEGSGDADPDLSPYDRFVDAQKRAMTIVDQLERLTDEILEIRDADGQPLADKHGLDRGLMGEMPGRINEVRDLVLLSLAEDQSDDGGSEPAPEDLDAIESALMASGEDSEPAS